MNLNRELEDLHEKMEQTERLRVSQARELDDLMSSKDDVGKSVSADFNIEGSVSFQMNCIFLKQV